MQHLKLSDIVIVTTHGLMLHFLLSSVVPKIMPYQFPSCDVYTQDYSTNNGTFQEITTSLVVPQKIQSDLRYVDSANAVTLFRSAKYHLIMALITFLLTRYLVIAPYGKHAPAHISAYLSLPAWLSWIVQESPIVLNIVFFIMIEYPLKIERAKSCNTDVKSNVYINNNNNNSSSISISNEVNTFLFANTIEHLHQKYNWHSYMDVIKEGVLRCEWYILLLTLHYIYRTFIYSARLNKNARRVPLNVTIAATAYCLLNGRLQLLACITPWHTNLYNKYGASAITRNSIFDLQNCLSVYSVLTALGVMLFATGLIMNIIIDGYLVKLKKESFQYSIPMHWSFCKVSCPNFTAEIVEWIGYACVVFASNYKQYKLFDSHNSINNNNNGSYSSGSFVYNDTVYNYSSSSMLWNIPQEFIPTLAAVSFAVYVMSNLVPRGIAHHEWYLQKFGEKYRKLERKAVIPYLL